MNKFAILFLLAFFYISYAPAKAQLEVYWTLKGAIIDFPHRNPPAQTYKDSVYLYREGTTGWKFVVGDLSGNYSDDFPVRQDNTAVTENKVTIRSWDTKVSLTFFGDALVFYQSLFKLEKFSHEFNVSKVYLEGKILENVDVIKAIERERLLVALHGKEPRLIVSRSCSSPKTNQNPKQVTFNIYGIPTDMEIIVEFDRRSSAKDFREFFTNLLK